MRNREENIRDHNNQALQNMLNEETRKLIRGLEKGKSLEYLEFISKNISRLRKLLDTNGGSAGNEIFPVR